MENEKKKFGKYKRDVIKLVRVLVLTNWGGFSAKGANVSGNLSSSILCQTDVILHLSLRTQFTEDLSQMKFLLDAAQFYVYSYFETPVTIFFLTYVLYLILRKFYGSFGELLSNIKKQY